MFLTVAFWPIGNGQLSQRIITQTEPLSRATSIFRGALKNKKPVQTYLLESILWEALQPLSEGVIIKSDIPLGFEFELEKIMYFLALPYQWEANSKEEFGLKDISLAEA